MKQLSKWTVWVVLPDGRLGSLTVFAPDREKAVTRGAQRAGVHRDCVGDVRFEGVVVKKGAPS